MTAAGWMTTDETGSKKAPPGWNDSGASPGRRLHDRFDGCLKRWAKLKPRETVSYTAPIQADVRRRQLGQGAKERTADDLDDWWSLEPDPFCHAVLGCYVGYAVGNSIESTPGDRCKRKIECAARRCPLSDIGRSSSGGAQPCDTSQAFGPSAPAHDSPITVDVALLASDLSLPDVISQGERRLLDVRPAASQVCRDSGASIPNSRMRWP